jgi:hypothetical protein
MTARETFILDNLFWLHQRCPEEGAVRPYRKSPPRRASPQASQRHTGAVTRLLSDSLDPSMIQEGPHRCTIVSDQSP